MKNKLRVFLSVLMSLLILVGTQAQVSAADSDSSLYVSPQAAAMYSYTYQAGNGELIGSAAYHESTGKVFNVDSSSGFRIKVYSAANTTTASMVIYYASDNRGARLYVNGSLQRNLAFSNTNWGIGTLQVNNISLNSGYNDIEIRGGYQTSYAPDFTQVIVTAPAPTSYIKSSRYFNLDIPDTYLTGAITPTNLQRWMTNLDQAYDAYYDLVGKKPSNGSKITIKVATGTMYGWAWVYSEQPYIHWNPSYIKSEMVSINNNNDWSFGILHELGHLFDIDNKWNFNGEFWANTKMIYALEKTKGKANGYVGADIRNYYKGYYDRTLGLSEPTFDHDALTYMFMLMKDQTGSWNAYKNTFRSYHNLSSSSIPSSPVDKFDQFLDKLTYYGNVNVRTVFTSKQLQVTRANITK